MPNNYRYGKAIGGKEMPKPKRRLPQYDECLEEFLNSKDNYWEANLEALPSQNVMIVLSSLKWRIKNNSQYSGIRVVMSKGKIFLEKMKA